MTFGEFLNLDAFYGFIFYPSLLGLESDVTYFLVNLIA